VNDDETQDRVEALLDHDGHLGEAALVALADGVELEPGLAAHAERCEPCAARLADAALASIDLGAALREHAGAREHEREGRAPSLDAAARPPWWALAAATLLVVAGSLPELASGAQWIAAARLMAQMAKRALRSLVGLAGEPEAALATGLLLLGLGVVVALVATRWAKSTMERGAKHELA
jgi:hypothetical protein